MNLIKFKCTFLKWLLITLLLIPFSIASADQTIKTIRAIKAPLVDGQASDLAWNKASEVITHDSIANIDIKIKSVYTDENIYFLIRFPDSTENRAHKSLVWDAKPNLYKIDRDREDNFVFKWNMEPFPADITLSSDTPYKADIWYWKSFRTDHSGYADDKYHIYSNIPSSKSHRVFSKTGKAYHLTRKGDKGKSAYKNNIPIEYKGDKITGFDLIKPTGSRADVHAKGVWKDGIWTIEFSRKLSTGNSDDVYLEKGLTTRFGVSRYEVAGRPENKEIENPLFGAGEITEHLLLQFD